MVLVWWYYDGEFRLIRKYPDGFIYVATATVSYSCDGKNLIATITARKGHYHKTTNINCEITETTSTGSCWHRITRAEFQHEEYTISVPLDGTNFRISAESDKVRVASQTKIKLYIGMLALYLLLFLLSGIHLTVVGLIALLAAHTWVYAKLFGFHTTKSRCVETTS